MKHNILVCDDGVLQSQLLANYVSNAIVINDDDWRSEFLPAKVANSYDEAVSWLEEYQPYAGLYILDIDLDQGQSKNGLALAEKVRQLDKAAQIVFVTTHDEMAVLTYERRIQTLDYIVKQADTAKMQARINETLDLAYRRFELERLAQSQTYCYKVGHREHKENIERVIALRTTSVSHKLELTTVTGTHQFFSSLKKEEKDNDFWLRISQSCLVNPNHIQAVDIRKRFVTLSDGEVESISRDLARKVKKQLIAGGYFERL